MTLNGKILPNSYKYEDEKALIPDAIRGKDGFPKEIFNIFFKFNDTKEKIKELYNIMESNKQNFTLPETFKNLEKILKKRSAILFLKDINGELSGIGTCVIYNKDTILTVGHNLTNIKNPKNITIFDSKGKKLNIKHAFKSEIFDVSIIKITPSETTKKYKKINISEKININQQDLILAGYRGDKKSYSSKSPYGFSIDIFDTKGLKITSSGIDKNEISVSGFGEPGDSGSGVYSFDSKGNYSLIGLFRSIISKENSKNNRNESHITPISILNDNKNTWKMIF